MNPQAKQFIKENAADMTVRQLADVLRVPDTCVRAYCVRNNIKTKYGRTQRKAKYRCSCGREMMKRKGVVKMQCSACTYKKNHSPKKIITSDVLQRVIELRADGLVFSKIAEVLGNEFTPFALSKVYNRHMRPQATKLYFNIHEMNWAI